MDSDVGLQQSHTQNSPINLLQSSIKYTAEPPQGVKAGLKRTYGLITQVRNYCDIERSRFNISTLYLWHICVRHVNLI